MEQSADRWPFVLALSACVPLMIALWGLLAYWKRGRDAMKVMEKLAGPEKSIFFGNAMQFKRDGSDFNDQLLAWSKEYKDYGYFCLWFGPFHTMTLTFRPDYNELLLGSSRNINKSSLYAFVHPWLGTGLLTSNGEKWKSRRRLITPTFHFKILDEFIQVFEKQSTTLVSVLMDKCKQGKLDICPKITRCALDIICETSMGRSVNAQTEENTPYVNAVLRMSMIIHQRGKSPWLWPDLLFRLSPTGRLQTHCLNILHGFTNKVIQERLLERKSSAGQEEREVDEFTGKRKKRPLAFLDLLLDAYEDGQIDKEGIREEVDTLMFEGHDTTASAISWAIFLLGLHSEVQTKAQQEIDAFFESRPEQLTVESLKELKYLECVIKESLRLYPSVPFFGRKITGDFVIDGVTIPKGETVVVAPMALHRNPDVWPDPEKFDPDRFLPENSEGRHPYAYVPFSAGPRNCIGQRFAILEEKLVIATILRHFDIKSEQSRDEIRVSIEAITRPQNGIFVTLTPRE